MSSSGVFGHGHHVFASDHTSRSWLSNVVLRTSVSNTHTVEAPYPIRPLVLGSPSPEQFTGRFSSFYVTSNPSIPVHLHRHLIRYPSPSLAVPPLYAHTHPLAYVWGPLSPSDARVVLSTPIRSSSPCPVRHRFHRPDHKCGLTVRCVLALFLPGSAATGPCLCVPIFQFFSFSLVPCTITPHEGEMPEYV